MYVSMNVNDFILKFLVTKTISNDMYNNNNTKKTLYNKC